MTTSSAKPQDEWAGLLQANSDVDGVLLGSGGIDSITIAYDLARQRKKFRVLFMDLGKPSTERELAAAKGACAVLGVPLEVADLRGFTRLQLGLQPFRFIRGDELDTGSHPSIEDLRAFNVAIGTGVFYAALFAAKALYVGVIKEQADATPTLSQFFEKCRESFALLNPSAKVPEVLTPLIALSKGEVISKAVGLDVPLGLTWSCSDGVDTHCGVCGTCMSRKAGFKQAGITDPTRYSA